MSGTRYPYQLTNAIFASIEFKRPASGEGTFSVNLAAEVKVVDDNFPEKLQVNLRIKTVGEQHLSFSVELIGLFDLTTDALIPDKNIIAEFVSNRALHMLWPYVAQLVKVITSQMGVDPITIPIPHNYDLEIGSEDE